MFDDGAVPCPQTPLFNDLTRQNCSPALWYYHKYPQYYYAITITIIIAYKSVDNIMSGTTILIVTMERKDANGWTMAWLPWLQARAPLLLQHLLTITLLHCYTVTLLHCYSTFPQPILSPLHIPGNGGQFGSSSRYGCIIVSYTSFRSAKPEPHSHNHWIAYSRIVARHYFETFWVIFQNHSASGRNATHNEEQGGTSSENPVLVPNSISTKSVCFTQRFAYQVQL